MQDVLGAHGSGLLFLQKRRAQPDQHRDGDQQGEERGVQAGKAQRLVEGPAGDRDVIAGRVNLPDQTTEPLQGGNRVGQAAKIRAGIRVRTAVANNAATWVRVRVETNSPIPVVQLT